MWHHVYHPGSAHWLANTIVSALIHGLIYGAIFRIMRDMNTGEALLTAVLGIAFIGGAWWLWNRRGPRRASAKGHR
ncbi:MAG: hypothetical protein OWQ56_09875 [Acidithiobacillus caldus]|nr:hypothetical protein [Acidithiobacillus caldus]